MRLNMSWASFHVFLGHFSFMQFSYIHTITYPKEWIKLNILITIPNVGKYMQQLRLSYISIECQLIKSFWNWLASCSKVLTSYESPILRKHSTEICPYMAKKNMVQNVHSSITLNSPKLEITHLPIESEEKKYNNMNKIL